MPHPWTPDQIREQIEALYRETRAEWTAAMVTLLNSRPSVLTWFMSLSPRAASGPGTTLRSVSADDRNLAALAALCDIQTTRVRGPLFDANIHAILEMVKATIEGEVSKALNYAQAYAERLVSPYIP